MPRRSRPGFLRATPPDSYSDVILADSPVAFWRCNEGASSATLADSSGNSRTGTIGGTITTAAASTPRRNNAANRGTSGYFTVADSSAFRITGDVTLELWVRFASTPAINTFFNLHYCNTSGETSATNALYQLTLSRAPSTGAWQVLLLHESGSGTNHAVTLDFLTGEFVATSWNHVVMTRDTAALEYALWLNGKAQDSDTYAANPSGGGSAVFQFGRNPSTGSTSDAAHDIDEVAVYSSKLSAARIFEHYRAGRRAA